MKEFTHTITDALGIHARPAGLLAKAAAAFQDTVITVSKGSDSARATQLMRLMSLGVKAGDTVKVTATGSEEDAAIDAMRAFFTANL